MRFFCLRARDGEFRAPARVTFFCCQKKVTKENHSNLRFKDPLARGRQVQIWRCVLAELVRWVTLLSVQGSLVPLAPLPLTLCEGRIGCAGRVAIIKSRQSRPKGGFGWWRLMPPGYGGRRLRAGRETKDPSSVSFADTCLPAGRSAGLTRHRRVIQHCGPLKRKANGGVSFNTANPARGRLGGAAVGEKNTYRG